MNTGNVCIRNVISAAKDMGILEAAKLMRQHHVGCLVVVTRDEDGPRPIGIITDRDIVIEVLAEEVPLDTVIVEDVMTRLPLIARENDDLFDTIEMMRAKGVRRIPVTDSLGLLVGILTIDDLLKIIYEEMGNVVSLIFREQISEHKLRSRA